MKIYRAIKLIHGSGSIRKAAAELAISPSALNRAVQAFEEELDFPVFERIPGGVRLSEAGELLLDVVDRHLTEFGELQRQLGRLRHGELGALRISIGADIAAGLVLDCIAELESAFPGVSVEITCEDNIESLRQRRVHLALLTNPTTDDAVEVVYAHACPLVGWQRSTDPVLAKRIWELEQLRVLLPVKGTGSRTAMSHTLRRNRLQLTATSSLSAAQIRQHLQRSGGVAIFPDTVFATDDDKDWRRRLPLDFGTVQICVLRMASLPLTAPAQSFLAILQWHLENTSR